MYKIIKDVLDATHPESYLLETEAGVPGVDFVLHQKIERTVKGSTTISHRVIGVTTGEWVKVVENRHQKVTKLWFGYRQRLESAVAKLKVRRPNDSDDELRRYAGREARANIREAPPAMTREECMLVMDVSGNVPNWRKIDALAESLADRFQVPVTDVELIVVTNNEWPQPIPSKQGLFKADVSFHREDTLTSVFPDFAYTKDVLGRHSIPSTDAEVNYEEILLSLPEFGPIIGSETATILRKSEMKLPAN